MSQFEFGGWRLALWVTYLAFVAPAVCRLRGHQPMTFPHPPVGFDSLRFCARCRRPLPSLPSEPSA